MSRNFRDANSDAFSYNIPRIRNTMERLEHFKQQRLAQPLIDARKLEIRQDDVMDNYRKRIEEIRIDRINKDHAVRVMRDHAAELRGLKQTGLYEERAALSEPVSKRLKKLRHLFDETADKKEEDNPYSLSAVYKHNLIKQMDKDKESNKGNRRYQEAFDSKILEKRSQLQTGASLESLLVRPPSLQEIDRSVHALLSRPQAHR